MFELLKAIGLGVIMLLPLANPIATLALFLSLSKHMTENERIQQARLTSIYVFAIMIIAYYAGTLVMNIFGISIPGLRIAGGLIVSFIGFGMLFPVHTDDHVGIPDTKKIPGRKITNIAFVPLAMPSTAGPGTIAMIISWVSTLNEDIYLMSWIKILTPGLVFLTISIIVWITLRSSGVIMHLVGNNGMEAISRLMGFLLVCMGIQFVINGLLAIIVNVG